jgi:hypothetical protein
MGDAGEEPTAGTLQLLLAQDQIDGETAAWVPVFLAEVLRQFAVARLE